jgi:urea transport system permease protein
VKIFRRLLPWILLAIALFILPAILSDFRLNLFGRYFSLAITALAIDLIWGYTGLLSLGQGIFFALGGYGVAL